jgi:signal transduction histidine kinase
MSDPNDLDQLLAFFRIEESDFDVLALLRTPLEQHADELVDRFYHHLEQFPEPQSLLTNPEVRERLRKAQRNYLLSLAEPGIDHTYIQQRALIGQTHERVGLDTRWYFGAYSLYFSLLVPVVREHLGKEPEVMDAAIVALQKRLVFDAEIAIRQYIDRREHDLRVVNDQLKAEGRSLTLEVEETHQDLRKTEARAREAEQLASVATLISGLAHEIGTPMGVIRGHAEALGEAVEGERAAWRLNMILEQIDRITGIIQALLNMARPRESLRTSVDLSATLDTTLAFLTEKIKRRRVVVSKNVAELPPITADPEKLQQLFLNLLINAVDAMPEGGPLSVTLSREGAFVVARVKDSGAGIPSNQIDSIFEPFYTTKPAGRGNGLGLVVVKGIMDEHNGTVDVHSEDGVGTEFTIRFPIGN